MDLNLPLIAISRLNIRFYKEVGGLLNFQFPIRDHRLIFSSVMKIAHKRYLIAQTLIQNPWSCLTYLKKLAPVHCEPHATNICHTRDQLHDNNFNLFYICCHDAKLFASSAAITFVVVNNIK